MERLERFYNIGCLLEGRKLVPFAELWKRAIPPGCRRSARSRGRFAAA